MGYGSRQSQSYHPYYPGNNMKGPSETTQNLNHDIQPPSKDANWCFLTIFQ
jgi:hypothetical protein